LLSVVFRVLDVIPAIDNELLPLLQDLGNDDDLVGDITRDAVSVQEIDAVEKRRLHVPTQLLERGTIQSRSAVPVIDVFLHENGAGLFDLAFQFSDLALDRALFLLKIRAHAGVQGRLLHIPPLIPEQRQRVESRESTGISPQEESSQLVCIARAIV
jgi:hypothetical protein